MRRNFRETAHTTLFNGVMKFVFLPAVCRSWTGHGFCCLMLIALHMNWHLAIVCVQHCSLYLCSWKMYSNYNVQGGTIRFFHSILKLITRAKRTHHQYYPLLLSRVRCCHRMYAMLKQNCVCVSTDILIRCCVSACIWKAKLFSEKSISRSVCSR